MAQTVKNLPVRQETWVQSLGWEDSLEEDMATHSSILAWRIPWTEMPSGLQSMGLQRSGTTGRLSLYQRCCCCGVPFEFKTSVSRANRAFASVWMVTSLLTWTEVTVASTAL